MKLLSGGTSDADFRQLADTRIREARILYSAGEFDGAYYLGGYAVEFALKAILAKAVPAGVLLPWSDIKQLFVHDLAALGRHAEQLDGLTKNATPGLAASWSLVVGWDVEQRYLSGVTEETARSLLDAIDDPQNGILPWLKQHW